MKAILTGLKALLISSVGSGAWRDLAGKFFLRGLFLALIPICILTAINYFMTSVVQVLCNHIEAAEGQITGTQVPALQLGLTGAYLFGQLGLDQGITIILSMATLRWCVRTIPFMHIV